MHPALSNSFHPEDAEKLATRLEDLLVEFEVFQGNVRKLHWNRSIRPFLELSPRIALLDQVTAQNTQLVAEQVMALGFTPEKPVQVPGLMKTTVAPMALAPTVTGSLEALIQSCRQLLETVEDIWQLARDLNEPGTLRLMSRMIMQLQFAIHVFHSSRLALTN